MARRFLDATRDVFEATATCDLSSEDALLAANPTSADGVVLFNPHDLEVSTTVRDFLERATQNGAVALPVALDDLSRTPPAALNAFQSFDLMDGLRRRNLDSSGVAIVARAFAREALSRVQPTLHLDRLRFFLSYRRADGEGVVASLDRALSARHEHTFRDLIDIQVGDFSQQKIEAALRNADAVIFLDTPLAGESEWIAAELAGALGRHIPILWIRIGSPEGRVPLPVQPAASPHLTWVESSAETIDGMTDAVLEETFQITRSHVRSAQAVFHEIRRRAEMSASRVQVLDQRQMIYELSRIPTGEPYPARPRVHILQVYGRRPRAEDRADLVRWLQDQGLGPHEHECRSFDAAIMLGPIPHDEREDEDWCVIDHGEKYLSLHLPQAEDSLEAYREEQTGREMLLLGAFPEHARTQQDVIDAVRAIAGRWIRNGGRITFGGHPTFTPLIVETAHRLRPGSGSRHVRIFQSDFFPPSPLLEPFLRRAEVIRVPAAATRTDSLTLMRREMIAGSTAVAVVAIGGRTTEGGTHHPGIDEEVTLARDAHLPVYLVGAPGGEAAILGRRAARETPAWLTLGNRASTAENQEFLTSDDYDRLGSLLWRLAVLPR